MICQIRNCLNSIDEKFCQTHVCKFPECRGYALKYNCLKADENKEYCEIHSCAAPNCLKLRFYFDESFWVENLPYLKLMDSEIIISKSKYCNSHKCLSCDNFTDRDYCEIHECRYLNCPNNFNCEHICNKSKCHNLRKINSKYCELDSCQLCHHRKIKDVCIRHYLRNLFRNLFGNEFRPLINN